MLPIMNITFALRYTEGILTYHAIKICRSAFPSTLLIKMLGKKKPKFLWLWLDSMTYKVFSNLSNSMILYYVKPVNTCASIW